MKQLKIKSVAASVIVAACFSGTSFAASMSNQQIQAMVEKIVNQRTQALQHQVSDLRHQVANLQAQLHNTKHQKSTRYLPTNGRHVKNIGNAVPEPRKGVSINSNNPISNPSSTQVHVNNARTGVLLAGTPVYTSPYIGEHSAYDGSNLIVNQSTVNFDTQLLKQGQAMTNALKKEGIPFPNHPVVEVSGDVEALANVINTHPGNTTSDVNLAGADFDVYAQANPWVFGLLDFQWNDEFNRVYRVDDSDLTLNKAFITIGNLNRTPLYASFGQLYVPFGQYSSYMVSDPVTKLLARTFARAAVFGLYPQGNNGVFAAGYVFRSDTHSNAKSAAGGVNLGYKFDEGNVSGAFAVGGISNIADSQGMQDNAAPGSIPFDGFGTNSMSEQIYKAVPAVDVHGSIGYKAIDLIAEYVDTTTSFDPRAMTFNGAGARPSAGHVEAAYRFTWHNKPGSFAVSYGWTKDALALLLPHERYLATVNYSFWRDTVLSVEFRHDVNYSSKDTATGALSTAFNPVNKYVNMVTAQFSLYF